MVINEAPANDDDVLECASLSIVDVLRNNNVMVHVAPTTTIVIVCRGLHDLASLPPRSSCMTRSSFSYPITRHFQEHEFDDMMKKGKWGGRGERYLSFQNEPWAREMFGA